MSRAIAIRLAIVALEHQVQKYAFDGNLAAALGIETGSMARARQKKESYQQAIQVLEGMKDEVIGK